MIRRPPRSTRSDPLVPSTTLCRSHRCARDWGRFARIALNHAFGDVVCAGSAPLQVMLSFEFGVDAEGGADHAACSSAFADELTTRGIDLGKVHAGRTSGVTAVTIALLAGRPANTTPPPPPGRVHPTRPNGAPKPPPLPQK